MTDGERGEAHKRRLSLEDLHKLPARGSGRSHRAIALLPPQAVYVTPATPAYWYDISRRIGRHDITLLWHAGLANFVRWHLPLRKFSTVYFDHAICEHCTDREWAELMACLEDAKRFLQEYPGDDV
jgi:hypothetical protein